MDYTQIIKLKLKLVKLYEKGDINGALLIGESIIKAYVKSPLYNTKKYADDLFDIAVLYDKAKQKTKALKLYIESADIIKNLCGKDLSYTYRINNIAALYTEDDKPGEALNLFRESYRLRFKFLGEKDKLTVESLYNLGNAYANLEDYERAAHYLSQSLKYRREKDGDYIDNLNSLGYALKGLNDNENALKYLHLSLGLTSEVYGIVSLEYLSDLYYILNLYYDIGKYEKAFDYMDVFANIAQKVITNSYPRLSEGGYSNGYKASYSKQLDLDEAVKELKLNSEIGESNNLALSYKLAEAAKQMIAKENYDRAAGLINEALNIKVRVLGVDNIDYVRDLILLGSVYYFKGDIERVMECVLDIIDIAASNEGIYEECITALMDTFVDFDFENFTEAQKRDFFLKVYDMIEKSDKNKGFGRNIFGDFEP